MLKRAFAVTLTLILASSTWSAVAAPKTKVYQPKSGLVSRCAIERGVKGYERKLQDYLNLTFRCLGPNRVANSSVSKSKPLTNLTPSGALLPLETCKLPQPNDLQEFRGFPVGNDENYKIKRHPGAGSIIQIVGLSAPDAPAGKLKPSLEYKFYLDQLNAWFKNVNNSSDTVEIRIADKWFDFGEPFAPYGLSHENFTEKTKEFSAKAIGAVDPQIDFTGVDYVLFVVPSSTKYDVISQSGLWGQRTSEGEIRNMSLMMQPNFDPTQSTKFLNFLTVTMFIHELYHPGFNMGDQLGNEAGDYENRAMGQWGMFATGTTDMLQWQKWLLGFTTDSQVACAPLDKPTTSWLAPGSTKTNKQKLLVVPISSSEALIVESVRATGLNYKLSQVEQGALVYTIDMNERRRDLGYEVQFPNRRPWASELYSMDSAPLKKGESFTYKGVKITNVEWGDFGDVIKVEPVK